MTENACCVWDFTLGAKYTSVEDLKKIFRLHCKKWAFQLEKGGESGYEHYQGRISLTAKGRLPQVKNIFGIKETHLSITSKENRDNCFYVTKEETRIAGPWTDQDTEVYIPRQYRGILENLYPWQRHIWEHIEDFEPRKINIVYDPEGNKGKSTLAAIVELHQRGIDVPPCNDGEKLIQSVADILISTQNRTPGAIFVDLPRSMDQTKLFGMYQAIEQIKKGKVYDFRYKYQYWWFDSPQIWVFCNTMPHQGYVSADRWVLWEINAESELVRAAAGARPDV